MCINEILNIRCCGSNGISNVICRFEVLQLHTFQLHILGTALQRRHNDRYSVSNHQRLDCLLNHLFMCRSKKTSKLRVTGLCKGNIPVSSEIPTQIASNAENVSIWWRHHGTIRSSLISLLTSWHSLTLTASVFVLAPSFVPCSLVTSQLVLNECSGIAERPPEDDHTTVLVNRIQQKLTSIQYMY